MSTHARSSLPRRSTPQKIALLLVLAAAVFLLPYFFPVRPVVGLSYVAGFNNKVATLLLIAAIGVYAWFTHAELPASETRDTPLSFRVLLIALAVTALMCVARRYISLHSHPGAEAPFFLDRQQLAAAGQRLYFDIEFPYGPLLLYPGLWIARIFHVSQVTGYYAGLDVQWFFGIIILWASIRWINFPIRFRRGLFAYIYLTQIVALIAEGSNYTMLRLNIAFFFAVATHTAWTRTHSSWRTVATAVAGVALGLACSLEQAVAMIFGLSAYLVLLALVGTPRLRWSGVGAYVLGSITCLLFAAHIGMFATFNSFSAGGLNLPITPSPSVLLALLPYVVAGIVCCRAVLCREWQSPAIPLTLVGAAMLPYALGRADIGHIPLDIPLGTLGIASIFTMPSFRRWWLPLALALGFVVPAGPMVYHVSARMLRMHLGQPDQPGSNAKIAGATPMGQAAHSAIEIDNSLLTSSALPCDRTYYSPSLMPSPMHPFDTHCLERGFYRGLWHDVMTPADIQRKINEMRSRPAMPLILENQPLEITFAPIENHMEEVKALQFSPFLPPTRHAPITFDAVKDYIQQHYQPGPEVAQGRARIWYPIAASQAR